MKTKMVKMLGMAMPFSIRKPSLLLGGKVGDKVKFNVTNVSGTATTTALRVQK
jgi:Cu/Ag efflux protein CusF